MRNLQAAGNFCYSAICKGRHSDVHRMRITRIKGRRPSRNAAARQLAGIREGMETLMSNIAALKRIKQILTMIYSKEDTDAIFPDLKNLMDVYAADEIVVEKRKKYHNRVVLNEKDAVLITYADTLYRTDEKPLATLYGFLKRHVKGGMTGVHILPFFPSSSDGGYSVIDYKAVDPRLGSWEDVRKIAKEFRLMVDLVMNHVSSRSEWFKGFLRGDKRYRDYFIRFDNRVDLPKVFRPRETPLLTKFDTAMGEKYVWTTFSADQIDLNFKNPQVLLEIIEVLLFYLSHGVEIVRLDAIGYIWKKPNSSCVNLPKTHQIVKLLRSILEYVAPYALILTEANFPYKDNIAYFGEGHEANMVYRFSLPPLVIDAFARQDASYIRQVTNRKRQDLLFFDFLASQDGIGLLSAKDILSKEDLSGLIEWVKRHKGLVSYRSTNGGKDPYELNISYFDAINDPDLTNDPYAVKRFVASQAIMILLKGVPGIYIHSLLGSGNYYKGVEETGMNRMINREKLPADSIEAALSDEKSRRFQVLHGLTELLGVRGRISSFHPGGNREVKDSDNRLLVIRRSFRGRIATAVINVSRSEVALHEYEGQRDAVSGKIFEGIVEPYEVYILE